MSQPQIKRVRIFTSDEVKNTIIPKVECRSCGRLMNEYNFVYDEEKDIITKQFSRKCDECYKDDYWARKKGRQDDTI